MKQLDRKMAIASLKMKTKHHNFNMVYTYGYLTGLRNIMSVLIYDGRAETMISMQQARLTANRLAMQMNIS
jgi:hypothetical protein